MIEPKDVQAPLLGFLRGGVFSALTGVTEDTDLIASGFDSLSLVSLLVFVEKTFGPEVKKRTLDMTKEIQKAMEADLKQLSWMGDATKKQAIEKLHGMVNKIGYPDQWRDYSSIKISRDDFFANVSHAKF